MNKPMPHQWNAGSNRTLRSTFALAAVFATVATLGLAVVTPASLAPTDSAMTLAREQATTKPVEVAILPGTIEVIATRTKAAAAPSPYLPASYRPRG